MPVSFSIQSNIHDYDVFVEQTPEFIETLAVHPQACFVVDKNVWNIYAETLLKSLPEQHTIVLRVNEDRKNLETVQDLYDHLVERPAKRNLTLISLGGGILQDITGFAASTLYRGIKWIYVPTTLLAQADSCIGSKTSLNFRKYKNLIGTFYPPRRIYIYPPFVQSQLDIDFLSGIGEVVKLHLMGGIEYFRELVQMSAELLKREPAAMLRAIQRSLHVKLSYIIEDEFDTGRRNLLNFGHDFGHALETTSNFAVPHGQAVIFGMLAANLMAERRALLDERLEQEIAASLLIPSLVIRPSPEAMEPKAIVSAMKKDKKRTGDQLALIMMTDGFSFTRVNDVTPEEVISALDALRIRLSF